MMVNQWLIMGQLGLSKGKNRLNAIKKIIKKKKKKKKKRGSRDARGYDGKPVTNYGLGPIGFG